jgi:hypothetical protein
MIDGLSVIKHRIFMDIDIDQAQSDDEPRSKLTSAGYGKIQGL